MNRQTIKHILENNYREKIYYLFKALKIPFNKYQEYLKFNGSYEFEDRSEGSDKLVIIAAGYEQDLWEEITDRIHHSVPEKYDVCIVSSGVKRQKLADIARENNWSYLFSKSGRIGQAWNLAIEKHPQADYIFKLDEDMFISSGFFENIIDCYQEALKKPIEPGFVVPTINVNTFSYTKFLEFKESESDYQSEFGELKQGFNDLEIHKNPDAAKFVWRETFPIDETSDQFGKNKEECLPVPYQFSIGAIMFTRKLWADMEGFKPGRVDQLGLDEEQLAAYCTWNGLTPVMSTRAFAGHLSYGPQKEEMKSFFHQNKDKFSIE